MRRVQSASLCWNSPKIFHTIFETLPVVARSLSILTPDYWHPPRAISWNISKIWWQKFFMHLSTVNELISKACTSQLGLTELTHVCGSLMSACMTGQLGKLRADNSPAGSLNINCQPLDCTVEHYISLPGMEQMSVELRKKYMVIHMYGITLNTAICD